MKKVLLLCFIVIIFSIASINTQFRAMMINATYTITTPIRLVSVDLLYRVGLLTCPYSYHIDNSKSEGDWSRLTEKIFIDNCRGKTNFN